MKIIWNDALSPEGHEFISLAKARHVFDRVFWPGSDQVIHAPSATPEVLSRVHSAVFVSDVLSGRARNGYGDTDPIKNAHSLAACGVMVRAIQEAVSDPLRRPIMAPVNGFHHAHYDNCYGFCTFNGVMAGIAPLGDYHKNVLIIDGDGHDGDGTDDIMRRTSDKRKFTRPSVLNLSSSAMRHHGWAATIAKALKMTEWDLVVYQAGADAHIDDSFGAGYLDDDAWYERDELIFGLAAELKLPLVWNLAGGYNGEVTLKLHEATAKAARVLDNHLLATHRSTLRELKPAEQVPADPVALDDVAKQRGPAES